MTNSTERDLRNPEALAPAREGALELSVVMPCLNEAKTVGICVRKAFAALKEHGISGEVIVADNGSADGSEEIARSNGARVIAVAKRGYGNALTAGICHASAQFVLMADSDDSYDLGHLPELAQMIGRDGKVEHSSLEAIVLANSYVVG